MTYRTIVAGQVIEFAFPAAGLEVVHVPDA